MQRRIFLASLLGAWCTIGLAVALLSASCSDAGPALPAPSPTAETASPDETPDTVYDDITPLYVGGSFDSVSVEDEELIILNFVTGEPVVLTLDEAEGPGNHFFRQETAPEQGMVLSQAAPEKGEAVCILAWLIPGGELIARLVLLESTCQHIP
ncbi:MAG: hypothetical protein IH865_08740 [Chloroflexi bacterium]|nr:hypothetical protein [Chloroflexota bacterium]